MDNQLAAKAFKKLLDIADVLLGPNGCAWDREQTFASMRAFLLEETCEVIEAINEGKTENLIEELGDLLFNFIFICKLAEREGHFNTASPIENVEEKLVSRHPHVFGEKKLTDQQAIIEQWERIKKEEKGERKSAVDGIPKELPALARAYKMAGKIQDEVMETPAFADENELGKILWSLAKMARSKKIHPEIALIKEITAQEKRFRENECES